MNDGDLLWGVRRSFVQYVTATGAVEVTFPATRDTEGRVRFPFVERTEHAVVFSGGLTFRAHHDLLSLTLADPWIEKREGGDVLTVRTASGVSAEGVRVVFASVLPDGSALLAEAGVALFDFQYPAGTELDPILFVSG